MCRHGDDAIEHDANGNEVRTRCRWCPESDTIREEGNSTEEQRAA